MQLSKNFVRSSNWEETQIGSQKFQLLRLSQGLSILIDPQGRPTVTAGSDHYFRTSSVRPHLSQNKTNFKRKQYPPLARLWVWPSGSLMTPVLCWIVYLGIEKLTIGLNLGIFWANLKRTRGRKFLQLLFFARKSHFSSKAGRKNTRVTNEPRGQPHCYKA